MCSIILGVPSEVFLDKRNDRIIGPFNYRLSEDNIFSKIILNSGETIIQANLYIHWIRDMSGSVLTRLQTIRPENWGSISLRGNIYSFLHSI
jgi:hypothetical protein